MWYIILSVCYLSCHVPVLSESWLRKLPEDQATDALPKI